MSGLGSSPHTAHRVLDSLDDYAQDRIISKLEEIGNDEWRDPPDYLEPLAGDPIRSFGSLRFGWVPGADRGERRYIHSGFGSAVGTPTGATTNRWPTPPIPY